jgi:hypothetical protein
LLEHETIDGTEVSRLLELARAGSTSANPHNGTSVPRSPSGIEDVVDAPVDADVNEN